LHCMKKKARQQEFGFVNWGGKQLRRDGRPSHRLPRS
jgi:hypothetical protein